MINHELPTLAELHHAPAEAFKSDKLSLLLNQPPHSSWIKRHPSIDVKDNNNNWTKLQYLPIDKIEFLLTRIFQQWKVEVIDYKILFHSVGVHIRLHYRNPVTGEWLFQDGLGAVVMQNDKDAKASDMAAIKSNAVQIGLPAAESYAIKDAAEKIGTIFGKDLNRRDTIEGFVGSYTQQDTQQSGTRSAQTPDSSNNSANDTGEVVLPL